MDNDDVGGRLAKTLADDKSYTDTSDPYKYDDTGAEETGID
jgi:hypothetical protein